jgi:RNA polymerase sigma-B factor
VSSSFPQRRSAQGEHLVEAHLPLVRSIARRYAGRGEPLDDLVQVGAVGLVRASKHFDSRRGVSFAAFAAPAIEGEIRRHLDDRTTSVRVPRELQRLGGRLRRSQAELGASLGRQPTVTELADDMGVEDQEVERAMSAERAREPVSPPSDALGEGETDSRSLTSIDDRLLLAAGARALDKRERRLVFLRFHADMTEREIAKELGISQAHVSRLLGGALGKLRKELNDQRANTDGTANGETEENRATSSADMATKPPEASRNRQSTPPNAATESAAISQSKADPALPYHVTLKQGQDGERSWWTAALEELPSCQARGATQEEAVDRLRAAMQGWLSAAVAGDPKVEMPKQEAPKRKSGTSHSGRFLVRMPSALHEELSLAAERQHVSLNRFVTDSLAAAVSSTPGDAEAEGDEAAAPSPSRRRRLRMLVMANVVVTVVAAGVAVTLLVLALERGI